MCEENSSPNINVKDTENHQVDSKEKNIQSTVDIKTKTHSPKKTNGKQSPEKLVEPIKKESPKKLEDPITKESSEKLEKTLENQSPKKLDKSSGKKSTKKSKKPIKEPSPETETEASPKSCKKVAENEYDPTKKNYHPIKDAFWDHGQP